MNSRFKILVAALAFGLVLTILSVAVPHDVSVAVSCSGVGTTQVTRGYPFGYLLSDSSQEGAQFAICTGENSAVSDAIASHTPGHQRIFGFIDHHQIDLSSLSQDFIIMTLIAAFPASLWIQKAVTFRKLPLLWRTIGIAVVVAACILLVGFLQAGGTA